MDSLDKIRFLLRREHVKGDKATLKNGNPGRPFVTGKLNLLLRRKRNAAIHNFYLKNKIKLFVCPLK